MRITARAGVPVAAALVVAAVVAAVPAVAAQSGPARATGPATVTWSPALSSGEGSGVLLRDGRARLDPRRAFVAPATAGSRTGAAEGGADLTPTGLLTLPVRRLGTATGEVDTQVDADAPAGSAATVDVRGRQPSGNWSEWMPAGADGRVRLPAATDEVQARLVLTGTPGPVVSAVTLTARPGATGEGSRAAAAAPLRYRVFATREGLVGGTTANGHVITPDDRFVALPSRRALSPRGSSDYSVKVCAANGRCAFAPVWDIGPWNTQDDYWSPPVRRQRWQDLPQGVPQAQAAFRNGYNGGKDGYGRRVANPAGIDLGDGIFRGALGLKGNATVTVTYLWTGSTRLAKVVATSAVDVVGAPRTDAPVVGSAARGAGVPVTCSVTTSSTRFLQIGTGQFVRAEAVPDARSAPPCAPATAAPGARPGGAG
jgi:hypothetical protein